MTDNNIDEEDDLQSEAELILDNFTKNLTHIKEQLSQSPNLLRSYIVVADFLNAETGESSHSMGFSGMDQLRTLGLLDLAKMEYLNKLVEEVNAPTPPPFFMPSDPKKH